MRVIYLCSCCVLICIFPALSLSPFFFKWKNPDIRKEEEKSVRCLPLNIWQRRYFGLYSCKTGKSSSNELCRCVYMLLILTNERVHFTYGSEWSYAIVKCKVSDNVQMNKESEFQNGKPRSAKNSVSTSITFFFPIAKLVTHIPSCQAIQWRNRGPKSIPISRRKTTTQYVLINN